MSTNEKLLYYLRTISEAIAKRRPTTYKEAMAMIDLFDVIATEAVRESSPSPT